MFKKVNWCFLDAHELFLLLEDITISFSWCESRFFFLALWRWHIWCFEHHIKSRMVCRLMKTSLFASMTFQSSISSFKTSLRAPKPVSDFRNWDWRPLHSTQNLMAIPNMCSKRWTDAFWMLTNFFFCWSRSLLPWHYVKVLLFFISIVKMTYSMLWASHKIWNCLQIDTNKFVCLDDVSKSDFDPQNQFFCL